MTFRATIAVLGILIPLMTFQGTEILLKSKYPLWRFRTMIAVLILYVKNHRPCFYCNYHSLYSKKQMEMLYVILIPFMWRIAGQVSIVIIIPFILKKQMETLYCNFDTLYVKSHWPDFYCNYHTLYSEKQVETPLIELIYPLQICLFG